MDKNKVNRVGIIAFISFIVIFGALSGYVFFNNTTNLAISIRSNDEQLKRDVVVNEALTRLVVDKNDSIKGLNYTIALIAQAKLKDSVIISERDVEIKKLTHEKDSLARLILKYKWSDIEPVNSKQPK